MSEGTVAVGVRTRVVFAALAVLVAVLGSPGVATGSPAPGPAPGPVAVPESIGTALPAPASRVAADRLVVRLAPGATAASVAGTLPVGGVRFEPLGDAGVHVVHVPPAARDDVAAALSRSTLVVEVEGDTVVAAARLPNDPLWPEQWGLQRIGAPGAWDLTVGAPEVVVAVLDTGVQTSHPDLKGALLPGHNVLTKTTDVEDDHVEGGTPVGHGTMVAGLVAARADNGLGVAGTCWTCRILPVKVLGSDGSGYATDSAKGIRWAVDNGADVINLSLGGPDPSLAVADAVGYAINRGVIVVAAAGNSGDTTPNYPAALPGVVSVAGSTSTDARYSWSSYGSWVDVAAPGCAQTTLPASSYGQMCGTSASAPIVAGVIGLALALHGGGDDGAAIEALLTTAVPVGSYVRFGRVDAAATVSALAAAAPQPEEPDDAEEVDEPTTDGSVLVSAACPADIPAHGYDDVVAGSTHERAIACAAWWGIAASGTSYRPGVSVTRAQMASFIARLVAEAGVALPVTPLSSFLDVDGSGTHDAAILRLADLGIVGGLKDGTYGPGMSVTRGQMATFIARALVEAGVDLPSGEGALDLFSDVLGTGAHDTAILRLADAGIVSGRADGSYGAGATVTRAQMATFLRNALDRLVGDGLATLPQ